MEKNAAPIVNNLTKLTCTATKQTEKAPNRSSRHMKSSGTRVNQSELAGFVFTSYYMTNLDNFEVSFQFYEYLT